MKVYNPLEEIPAGGDTDKSVSGRLNVPETALFNPRKFMMYLYLISTVMLFAGLTSAVIVRNGAPNWKVFKMPAIFWFSTLAVILSSVSLHWSVSSAKKNRHSTMVSGLWITVLLGVFFLIAQFMGFASLVGNKIFMVDKTSSSNQYFYVLIFIHAVHLIGGTLALVILLLKAIRFRIHAGNTEGLELAAIFWHFLDGLWVYLFIFMNIYFT